MSDFPNSTRLPSPVRITEQVWPEGTVPVVSVLCVTYNHVNFIRDAIEGFLMQETTFPVEIVIHDDASTDGTTQILKDYEKKFPTLIRNIIQPKNLWPNLPNGAELTKSYCLGKFIAFCDGDDYWTDPQKLQNQYETLIRCDYSIVCTKYYELQDNILLEPSCFRAIGNKNVANLNFDNWHAPYLFQTTTVMFKKKYLEKHDLGKNIKAVKDIFIFCCLLKEKNGIFLNKYTSVYRKHSGGTHSGASNLNRSLCNLRTARSMLVYFKRPKSSIKSYYESCLISASLESSKIKRTILCRFLQIELYIFRKLGWLF